MSIKLTKEPNRPNIICGFPGFGLVGSITTEFLLNHLNTEQIGNFCFTDVPATVAIHEGKLIHPFSIHYNQKYNLVIVHGISPVNNLEWKIADIVAELSHRLEAFQVITIEGVGTTKEIDEPTAYHFALDSTQKSKLDELEIQPLKEGIVVGLTGSLLIKSDIPIVSFFAETHSQLPDSKAAAKIIEVLDKYLKLEVDYHPLLESAEKFEEQLKNLMEQGQIMEKEKNKKNLSYLG